MSKEDFKGKMTNFLAQEPLATTDSRFTNLFWLEASLLIISILYMYTYCSQYILNMLKTILTFSFTKNPMPLKGLEH